MIQSMTAFARASEQGKWGTATWEIRSLNHRYLDCNLRLPETLRALEPKLREISRKHLNRGRVECFLKYQPSEDLPPKLSINTALVKQLASATSEVNKYFNQSTPAVNPMHVLGWNNVLQLDSADIELIGKKIVELFERALKELCVVREKEGDVLRKLICKKLQILMTDVAKIKKLLPGIVDRKRTNILSHLNEIKGELDQTRLEQEMVFFAQKIDVAEELDRLDAHIVETERTFKKGGTIGKRLDFLMQELNREANTLASKSIDKKTTHASIELKVIIEQMREQIQNIE